MPSPVPGLVQDDSNVGYCNADNLPKPTGIALDNSTFYHCPHLISLELNKVYEFVLIDDTTDETVAHPIHMHGNSFQVIDMGSLDQLKSGKTPFANATFLPVVKDTGIAFSLAIVSCIFYCFMLLKPLQSPFRKMVLLKFD